MYKRQVGILAATLVLAFCPLQAFAAAGDTVVHKKSGMDMSYTIVRDAGAAQGAVVLAGLPAVSYTHLDVYKRQARSSSASPR